MSSAAEAKFGALFINTKTAVFMQCTLKEMGHQQSCTPIQTETARALLTNKIMPRALMAMDMRFHWLHCPKAQDQYCFTGDLEHNIWQITEPSIIQPATTKLFGHKY
jgi:hypothetical protein